MGAGRSRDRGRGTVVARRAGRVWALVLIVGLLVGLLGTRAPDAGAQDLSGLVASCAAGGSAALVAPCRNTILAAQAIRGGVAVVDAMGSQVAGSSSTLGRRLGRTPRVSLGARFRVAAFDMPDILADGAALPGKSTVVAYGMKATVVAGVLDGFSVLPSVGGFLSLDLLASLNLVWLQESDGFTENEGLISVGGRVGLLRESFTMPGVTLSLVQHYGSELSWGGGGDADAQLDTDMVTTSLRATVGKDLFALALQAGAGFDWQKGDFGVLVPDPGVPGGQGVAVAQGVTTRRPVYYVGASLIRLVFQVSLEAGWAGGYDDLPGYQGAYDPGSITPFANLALRLTI